MSLNYRQQHRLYRIESQLLRSDPQFVAVFTGFTKYSAGEAEDMPAREQVACGLDRTRHAVALIVRAIVAVAAMIGLLIGAVRAALVVIVVGSDTRSAKSARKQTGSQTNGRPDPASWT
jgi:hypothetical protein